MNEAENESLWVNVAIAFRSRGGGRLLQFLSGDLSLELVTGGDRPVIALPRQ